MMLVPAAVKRFEQVNDSASCHRDFISRSIISRQRAAYRSQHSAVCRRPGNVSCDGSRDRHLDPATKPGVCKRQHRRDGCGLVFGETGSHIHWATAIPISNATVSTQMLA
jgi:hypothetical protein